MDNVTLCKTLRQQRKKLCPKQRQYRAFLASLHLRKLLPLLPKNAKVAFYLDDFGELPTAPIVKFCQKYGFTPFLPITQKNKPLRFAPVFNKFNKTPLKRHQLGMQEPFAKNTLTADKLDCIICPLVAVDKAGNRLGMGGGFYDRTFAKAPKVLKVGWCYDFQVIERLTINPWDKRVDLVMTNQSVIRY